MPGMGAEDLPQLLVPALAGQMQVDFAERRQEAVWLVDNRSSRVVHLQPIVRHLRKWQHGNPDPFVLADHREAVGTREDGYRPGQRLQGPDGDGTLGGMSPQDAVRIVVHPLRHGLECCRVDHDRAVGKICHGVRPSAGMPSANNQAAFIPIR
jgi:hypothetical protein